MNVTVNDKAVQTLEREAASDAGLDTLLDSLKKRGDIPADEVVVSLEVDGRKWTAEDMGNLESTPLESVAQVAVSTAGVREYGIRVLSDAASMLQVIREGTQMIAREFREGAPDQANSHLFLLLDSIQSLFGCLFRVTNACRPDLSVLQDQSRLVRGITASLEAIQECQEKQDWNGLADRLENDLTAALDTCRTAIDLLQKEL